eukprot:m.68538 g.68538  ORF g.68538 m.68538 type:complete len:429 (+) comp50013_c0_seq24:2023-3309(+)
MLRYLRNLSLNLPPNLSDLLPFQSLQSKRSLRQVEQTRGQYIQCPKTFVVTSLVLVCLASFSLIFAHFVSRTNFRASMHLSGFSRLQVQLLCDAVADDNQAACEELVRDCGKDIILARTIGGTTALHASARRGRVPILRWFLQQGIDSNALNKDGLTALMCATEGGHLECIKELIAFGAEQAQAPAPAPVSAPVSVSALPPTSAPAQSLATGALLASLSKLPTPAVGLRIPSPKPGPASAPEPQLAPKPTTPKPDTTPPKPATTPKPAPKPDATPMPAPKPDTTPPKPATAPKPAPKPATAPKPAVETGSSTAKPTSSGEQPGESTSVPASPSLSAPSSLTLDGGTAPSRSFEQTPLHSWNDDKVAEWLTARMLDQHIPKFRDNGMKGPTLAELCKEDLADAGITLRAHQTVILNDLAKFKALGQSNC